MSEEKQLTGYPSIDKPWLKYYSEEAINAPLPECTIYEYLWENNKDRLDSFALNYFDHRIIYGQLFENIEKTAKGLFNLGVRQGDIVTIFSSNTPETIYCIYALNYIGAIANMEYVTESEKEAIEAIKKCESKVVIVLDALLDKFKVLASLPEVQSIITLPVGGSMPAIKKAIYKFKTKTTHCDKELPFYKMIANATNSKVERCVYVKNSPAVIVHSGGTTGTPKGVVLSNDNLNSIPQQYKMFNPDYCVGDTFMHSIPPFHAFGIGTGIHLPLIFGFELYITLKFDEKYILNMFLTKKPVHVVFSGTHIKAITSSKKIEKVNLSQLKTFGLGGTQITADEEKSFNDFLLRHKAKCKTSIGYGMSEVSSTVCTEMKHFYGKPGSCGIPLCKSIVKVIDINTGKEMKYCNDGELCISAPGLMLQYFKNEKETKNAIFVDKNGLRWIHTGDIGHVDEDGFVFITGRLKRIYTTRSERDGTLYKIFPDHVSNIINEFDEVKESAVVCIEDPDYKNIGIAFIVLKEQSNKEEKEMRLMDYLNSALPAHSVPKKIYFIDKLPLTPVGKIDYRALEKQAEEMK